MDHPYRPLFQEKEVKAAFTFTAAEVKTALMDYLHDNSDIDLGDGKKVVLCVTDGDADYDMSQISIYLECADF